MTLIKPLSFAFRCRCESIATEQRAILGLRAFDPLPAYVLANKLNAIVMTPEQFPSLSNDQTNHLLQSTQWSGAILCLDPLWIVLNPNHKSGRRESDLMHELSHVLLNHKMAQFDPKTGLPIRSQLQEDEAAFLGGCLQIPHRGLLWAVQQGWPITQIANHFGASEAMVNFRINRTSTRKVK